jgi:hypothetical protein
MIDSSRQQGSAQDAGARHPGAKKVSPDSDPPRGTPLADMAGIAVSDPDMVVGATITE